MCNIIIHRVPSGVKIPSRSCRDMQSLKCTSLLRIFGTNWCVQVKEKERERERVEACIRRDDDVVALLDVAERLCIFYLTENCFMFNTDTMEEHP